MIKSNTHLSDEQGACIWYMYHIKRQVWSVCNECDGVQTKEVMDRFYGRTLISKEQRVETQ